VLISGGFDPVHEGHLDYIERASEYGKVIIALNSDKWLMAKKGYVFMPWNTRARILTSVKYVYSVIAFNDSDGTVCDALRTVKPKYFANGGDRTSGDPREHKTCAELGIIELFNIGGGKTNSSSELIENIRRVS